MSVGLQRIREDAERVRQGAIDKREDPSLVDRAVTLDAERRRQQAERDALKARRNELSETIGARIRAGADPKADPEVAELRAESSALGGRIDSADAAVSGRARARWQ